MAFERLQSLGEERFLKIKNDLMLGVPCMQLARVIQQDWKEMQDVAEKTLTQQLNRFKQALGGPVKPTTIEAQHKQIRLDTATKINILEEMTIYHAIQSRRVQRLVEKEAAIPSPTALSSLETAIMNGIEILKDIQKVRFELGIDAYAGPTTGTRGAMERTTNPDGSTTEKAVFEAYTVAQEVFGRRGIKAPPMN